MGTRKGYGQFCPVAQAAEIVAERWTPLVLRELMCGSHRFNDLRKGVPLMSPSLLSKRLKELEEAGVVERRGGSGGVGVEYHLSEAGRELGPIIEGLGLWGHRFARRELKREELDPGYLMWDVRRGVHPERLPEGGRTVVRFDIAGVAAAKRRWWLVFRDGDVDLCLKPPGGEVDLRVEARMQDLTAIWLGDVPIGLALKQDKLRLTGAPRLVRSFARWFGPSRFALAAQR